MVKRGPEPAVMPAPQSPGAVPGFTQVDVPCGTTFQPLPVSRLLALVGLYEHGAPALPLADSQLVTGEQPTGPTVALPDARSAPARPADGLILHAQARRRTGGQQT